MRKKFAAPKTTSPLTKLIRTGEGVLVYAFNAALLVIPIASSALSAKQALAYAGIFNLVVVVSRTGLKIAAQIKPQTGVTPQPLSADVTAELTALTETVAGFAKQLAAPVSRVGVSPGGEGAIRWQPEASNPSA